MASRLSGRTSERHDRNSGQEKSARPRQGQGVDGARLPSAPRERRPLLAALAVLLIAAMPSRGIFSRGTVSRTFLMANPQMGTITAPKTPQVDGLR